MSSIVRKLYYSRRPTPLPRVAVGVTNSWDPSIVISSAGYSYEASVTWSPCGRFVAVWTEEGVKIRDALTFELLSTFQSTEPTSRLKDILAYSPDGRSLACVSSTAIIIWDIQTGGVAKGVERGYIPDRSLAWSLDGKMVGTMGQDLESNTSTVRRYDIASGTALSPITLRSEYKPYLWAHGVSFRVLTTARHSEGFTINIFEVGALLTKIESFPVRINNSWLATPKSFSPTTYRISLSNPGGVDWLLIFDVRNSERLLMEMGDFESHCFSSDGSLFAACSENRIHIWKHATGRYTPWREFPFPNSLNRLLQFSPTSSSILVCCSGFLRVWRLDVPPAAFTDHSSQLVALSHSGTYVATANDRNNTVTITNLLSRTPSQLIDTGLEMRGLAITGNVLLVVDTGSTMAWLLTEEGRVDGVPGNRRAGPGDSIWTVSMDRRRLTDLKFLVEGQTGVISSGSDIPHVYHTQTGEVIGSSLPPYSVGNWWDLASMSTGRHHLRHRDLDRHGGSAEDIWPVSRTSMREGWVKDPAGKHRLWLPVEWRTFGGADWFYDITTLQLRFSDWQSVIKF